MANGSRKSFPSSRAKDGGPHRTHQSANQNKRIVRCQAWKIPAPKLAVYHTCAYGKQVKLNYSHDYSDFEYFCPACNLTFRCFEEYQSHIILKEQQRPYQEEIRETVRFMKEVVEHIPHKEQPSVESLGSPERPRNSIPPRRLRGRLRNMPKLVDFTMQLELLQNKIDYDEENLHYSQKNFKFATSNASKSRHKKRYFDLDAAVEAVKRAKQRLIEIKRKKEFREIHRVAKCVPSMVNFTRGNAENPFGHPSGDNHNRSSAAIMALARQSRKWKERMSELKESSLHP